GHQDHVRTAHPAGREVRRQNHLDCVTTAHPAGREAWLSASRSTAEGKKRCVSTSHGARDGRHRITWPHGLWQISPGRAGACCATASSCSTTEASCFLM